MANQEERRPGRPKKQTVGPDGTPYKKRSFTLTEGIIKRIEIAAEQNKLEDSDAARYIFYAGLKAITKLGEDGQVYYEIPTEEALRRVAW
jgi:hypothetical protein